MRYRVICSIMLAAAVLGAARGALAGPEPSLPAIAGWQCGELRDARLDAVSGNQGYWQERVYRTDSGLRLTATLMYGPGTKFYNQPPAGVSSANGASTYEIITIGGCKSSIEFDPELGYSVSVNAFDRKFSLTAESGAFTGRDELIQATETLLAGIGIN